jgi:hypothetical protein
MENMEQIWCYLAGVICGGLETHKWFRKLSHKVPRKKDDCGRGCQ